MKNKLDMVKSFCMQYNVGNVTKLHGRCKNRQKRLQLVFLFSFFLNGVSVKLLAPNWKLYSICDLMNK